MVEYLIQVNHVTRPGAFEAVGELIPFLIRVLELTSIF
jgi:hypothetical protein